MNLALDLATKTGWATRQNGKIISGVQDFSLKRGDSPGMRYIYFVQWLHKITGEPALAGYRKNEVDTIIYEQAHHRGGASTEIASGFATHLQSFCAKHGNEHTAVHTATLKKFATGSGRGDKSGMIRFAKDKLGRDPIDDNEADAVCLLCYAEENILTPADAGK